MTDLDVLSGPWSLAGPARAVEVGRLLRWTDGLAPATRDRLAVTPRRWPDDVLSGGFAVIPITGVLLTDARDWALACGFASVAGIVADLERAAANPGVRRIVLVVDSPGGVLAGVLELADAVRRVGATKPIAAVITATAEAGAFVVASAAAEVIAAPRSTVSITGAVFEHLEGDQARSGDALGRELLSRVARWRGLSLEDVEATFGDGRIVPALEALAAGLVDRLDELADVVAERCGPAVH